jgi:hypothetical protein
LFKADHNWVLVGPRSDQSVLNSSGPGVKPSFLHRRPSNLAAPRKPQRPHHCAAALARRSLSLTLSLLRTDTYARGAQEPCAPRARSCAHGRDGGGVGGCSSVPGAVGAALRGRERRRRRPGPRGRGDIVGGGGAAETEGGGPGAAGAAAGAQGAVAGARPHWVARGRGGGRPDRAVHLGGDAWQVAARLARLRDQVLHAAAGWWCPAHSDH